MFELVLFACLLKDPHHCESFRLPFSYEMQAPQCLWQSQMKAAQWAGRASGLGHPQVQLRDAEGVRRSPRPCSGWYPPP